MVETKRNLIEELIKLRTQSVAVSGNYNTVATVFDRIIATLRRGTKLTTEDVEVVQSNLHKIGILVDISQETVGRDVQDWLQHSAPYRVDEIRRTCLKTK